MTETITISKYEQDFKKKILSITSTSEPSTPDLTIINKQSAKINIDIKLGLDITFTDDGNIKFLTKESQSLLTDDSLEGLQEFSSGTITLEKDDKIDLSLWNTLGGTFKIVVLIFVNSKSDGTFIDPLAILETSSKTETLLTEPFLLSESPQSYNFSMQGYKNLILSLGLKNGLGNASIIEDLDAWVTPENCLIRNQATTNTGNFTGTTQIIIDCGQNITSTIAIGGFDALAGSGDSHYEVDYSTDNISYFNTINSVNLSTSTTTFKGSSEVTFRYIKIKCVNTSGTSRVHVSMIGLHKHLYTTVNAKIESSDDNGVSWSEFIASSEYDMELISTDSEAEKYTISRNNASNTGIFYIFPQGINKLRVTISLTLHSGVTDSGVTAGYGGEVTIEKIN